MAVVDRFTAIFRLVSQHALRRCRLAFEDRTVEQATLFPFFDDEGRTRAVLITMEETGRILSIEWTPDLLFRRGLRSHAVARRFADLRDASTSDVERLRDLWHFDPWWVLTEDRYRHHRAVPVLRATNIPGYDPTIWRMWFDGSLDRVAWVATRSAESMSARRFAPGLLQSARARRPPSAPSRAPEGASSTSQWRLRPFWTAAP